MRHIASGRREHLRVCNAFYVCVEPFVHIFIQDLQLRFFCWKVSRTLERLVQLPLFFSVASRIVRNKLRDKIYRDVDCRKAHARYYAFRARQSAGAWPRRAGAALEFCRQLFSSPLGPPKTASDIALLLIGESEPISTCRGLWQNTWISCVQRGFSMPMLVIAL